MMDIDSLTIKQVKELQALLATPTSASDQDQCLSIGKNCIVRTYASGVHFGRVVAVSGRRVELRGARRLWRWQASSGISLNAVAQNGLADASSKVTDEVPHMTLLDALELIAVSSDALDSIRNATVCPQS